MKQKNFAIHTISYTINTGLRIKTRTYKMEYLNEKQLLKESRSQTLFR
jgi:hypothetical protein